MSASKANTPPFTAAIVGAGAVGHYHIDAQRRAGSEIVIFEPNQDRAAATAEKFGEIAVARTLEEAIDRADVVHICTPHKYHAQGAIASIEQNTPVIVEKPLTIKLNEAVDIYRAAKRHNVAVMVGTSFRLTPPFRQIYDGLHGGEIGALISLETTYLHDMSRVTVGNDWRQSPDRGSFLYGGGAHAVDLNMWLANQPLTTVQATIGGKKVRPSYPGDEDFTLSLSYADGTTGRVWVSAAVPLPQHGADVKVYGTRGAYTAHNKKPMLNSYTDGHPDWVTTPSPLRHTIDEMSLIFNSFIRGERPDFAPMPDIEEGLQVMIALHTLEHAAQTGRVEPVPSVEQVVNT